MRTTAKPLLFKVLKDGRSPHNQIPGDEPMTTYTWLDGRTQDVEEMTAAELAAYRAEFAARLLAPVPQEIWPECELCGCGVSPQARTLGMADVHQHCFADLTPRGRETVARRHGVVYDARDEA